MGQYKNVPAFSTKTWWKIYSLTPPFNLIKCLLKLKEHWNIIARHQLFKNPQKEIEWLVWFFKDLQITCKLKLHIILMILLENYLLIVLACYISF